MRHLSWLIVLPLALGWAVGCGGDSEFTGPSGGSGKGGGSGEASGGTDATGGTGGTGGSSGKSGSGGTSGKGGTGGKGTGGSSGTSGKGGGSGTSGAAVALDDLPDAYADAYCSLLERCGGIIYELTTAYEDCRSLASRRFRQDAFGMLERAVDDGKVLYHAELVPACMDAVTTRACEDLNSRDIAECEAAIQGTAAEGEPCMVNEECEDSRICETNGCPGTCVDRYSAGLACSSNEQCADELVCSEVTAHCVKPPGEGEACGGGVEAQCAAGYLCVGDDRNEMRTGQCATFDSIELGAEGDVCDPATAKLCEEGLSCVITGVADDALTWECQSPAASGARCHLGLPEACPAGEYCPLDSLQILAGAFATECTPLPAAGEACAPRPLGSLLPECEPYARCGVYGRCEGLRELGQSCEGDATCYSSHCAVAVCVPAQGCY